MKEASTLRLGGRETPEKCVYLRVKPHT